VLVSVGAEANVEEI
jgi:hypothetical protein